MSIYLFTVSSGLYNGNRKKRDDPSACTRRTALPALHFIQLLVPIVQLFSLYSRATKMADRKRQVRSEAKVLKM